MDAPYRLADCYERDCHRGEHYHVWRTDRKGNGVVFRNSDGKWEVERPRGAELHRAFPDEKDAAWFAAMEGRFYCLTVATPFSERVQLRVLANFGYWRTSPSGQWVVSLHDQSGNFAASSSSAFDGFADAMAAGLRAALRDPMVTADSAALWKWEEMDVQDLSPTDPFRRTA